MSFSYYIYEENGVPFYYCIENGSKTYQFPVESTIYDPNSLTVVYSKGMEIPSYANIEAPTPPIEEVEEESKAEVEDQIEEAEEKSSSEKPKERIPITVEAFNCSDILSKVSQYSSLDFANKSFRLQKRRWYSFKTVPPSEMIKFQSYMIRSPLLEEIPSNLAKPAVRLFKHLLQYAGLKSSKHDIEYIVSETVNALKEEPELIDEMYFQLIKQTTECPDNEILLKNWEMFLVIATIFPSSEDTKFIILGHIAETLTNSPTKEIKLYSELAYIRFEARCKADKNNKHVTDFVAITKAPYTSTNCTRISVSECLWTQRNVQKTSRFPSNKKCLYAPNAQIPYVLHVMTQGIIKKGGKEVQGIFRIPGSLKKVEDAVMKINDDISVIDDMSLNDLASLFKRWWSELPITIFPQEKIEEIVNLLESESNDNDEAVLNILEPCHRVTLLYLIGFLREMATADEVTLMNAKNLSIVFAPNLYIMPTNLMIAKKVNTYVQNFMIRLIETADVSGIYPYVEDQ